MKMPLIWRRNRKDVPTLAPDELAATWQLCSVLLQYPEASIVEKYAEFAHIAHELPEHVGPPLLRFLNGTRGGELAKLQQLYVDTFDITRKCSLHLTYFTHGDTRRRGVALVEFKQAFRKAGVELADEDAELPDYLPVVLEFGAFSDADAAWKLLTDYRVGIELVRTALAKKGSPWVDVMDALRATLPVLDGDDEEALAKLIAAGPPTEDVGIASEPYAIDFQHDPRLNPRPEPVNLGSTIPTGAH